MKFKLFSPFVFVIIMAGMFSISASSRFKSSEILDLNKNTVYRFNSESYGLPSDHGLVEECERSYTHVEPFSHFCPWTGVTTYMIFTNTVVSLNSNCAYAAWEAEIMARAASSNSAMSMRNALNAACVPL